MKTKPRPIIVGQIGSELRALNCRWIVYYSPRADRTHAPARACAVESRHATVPRIAVARYYAALVTLACYLLVNGETRHQSRVASRHRQVSEARVLESRHL